MKHHLRVGVGAGDEAAMVSEIQLYGCANPVQWLCSVCTVYTRTYQKKVIINELISKVNHLTH